LYDSIKSAEASTTAFIGMTQNGESYENRPTLVRGWDEFVVMFGYYTEDAPFMAAAVFSFFLNGGEKAYIVKVKDDTDASVIGVDNGRGERSGLQSLLDLDTISIILVPGITSPAVMAACVRHCERLEDRIVIFDTPENMTSVTELIDYSSHAVSDKGFAVIYTPWYKSVVEYRDVSDGNKVKRKEIFIPPSGALAGLYAKVDREKGVNKAVANIQIEGALALKVNYNNSEQDILNPKGVNCIRMFWEKEILVWGARTTATNSELKYISIRRFLIFLKISIVQSTQWVGFEENRQQLWTKLKKVIENFLEDQWRKGALQGSTPNKSFFVKCGYLETMTAEDIGNGRVVCLIGVSLFKAEEFTILHLEWKTAPATPLLS